MSVQDLNYERPFYLRLFCDIDGVEVPMNVITDTQENMERCLKRLFSGRSIVFKHVSQEGLKGETDAFYCHESLDAAVFVRGEEDG